MWRRHGFLVEFCFCGKTHKAPHRLYLSRKKL
jgi:hypothetical protein